MNNVFNILYHKKYISHIIIKAVNILRLTAKIISQKKVNKFISSLI